MSDQEQSPPTPRRKRKTDSSRPVFILLIFIALTAAAAGIFFFSADRTGTEPAAVDSGPASAEPAAGTDQTAAPPASDDLAATGPEIGGESPDGGNIPGLDPVSAGDTPEQRCERLAERLIVFFQHLDRQEYIQPFGLKEPSQLYFIDLANRLLDNPPVVSRESDDLYTILKNMAHFFRVIGKDNIFLIKMILDRERDKIEDVAAATYLWVTSDNCRHDRFNFAPSLAKLYEYAGFFLETMGGRSYLFRRDSRSRLLVNYYSVLLVDLANEKGMNRYGIDIAQAVPLLAQEIDSSNQLIYKEDYLDRLYGLLEKYQ